jgi:hypothetical protein
VPRITHPTDLRTVIVTVDADADVLPALADHARLGLVKFSDYAGFRGGALHLSDDGCRMVQYLQWNSMEEYRACVEDPAWDDLPSTRAFMDTLASGRARLDVRSFRVEASSEGPATDPTPQDR